MDLSLIVSVVALIVSLLGTVFNILYSRKHLEIIKKEAVVFERENATKVHLGETLEAVQNLIDTIYEHADLRWFSFPDLRSLSDDIVRYLHDKKAKKLEIRLRPSYMQLSMMNEGVISEVKLTPSDRFEQFLDLFKKDFQGAIFYLRVTPEITEKQSIELGDPLISLKELHQALDKSRKFSDIVEKLDWNVQTELEETLVRTLRRLYEELMKEDQITVMSEITSQEISDLLLNKTVGYEAIRSSLEEIRGPLCKRLDTIQKELFHRS